MSDALARLQASGADTLAQATVEVCLAQGVVKEVEKLNGELAGIEFDLARMSGEGEGEAKPKMGSGAGLVSRKEAITAELERLYDVMREHTGRITVSKTIPAGDWRRWADANPARENGRDSNGWPIMSPFDLAVASGYCNASELMARLGDFVTEWQGEALSAGQWEWLEANIYPGELKAIARKVVGLYEGEGAKALPKSSPASSGTASTANS